MSNMYADILVEQNRAKTFNFVIDDFGMFERFLMLGSTDGSYNSQTKLQVEEGMAATARALKVDANRVLSKILEISTEGRAPSNDPAIVALVQAAAVVGQPAFDILGKVCRTGTHLFTFVNLYHKIGKWNAAAKRAVSAWYTSRNDNSLATQLLKYQSRGGWSHRDVLRLAHVKPTSDGQNAMFKYTAQDVKSEQLPALYDAVFKLNAGDLTPAQVINLIGDTHQLTWEMVPTQYLSDVGVLSALVPNMGMTALIRKLGVLTHRGVIGSDMTQVILDKIADEAAIIKGRVHPITTFQAKKQYGYGGGGKSSLTWTPNRQVLDALDSAFYAGFKTVEDNGAPIVYGVDISGSMQGATVNGNGLLTADEVAVVMAMACSRTNQDFKVFGFNRSLVSLEFGNKTIDEALSYYRCLRWDGGGTNVSQLFDRARLDKLAVDKFVVITDNDINSGRNPAQALRDYRSASGINAKMAVIATSLSDLSIADPKDRGMLDIAGFDSAAPALIAAM